MSHEEANQIGLESQRNAPTGMTEIVCSLLDRQTTFSTKPR